MDEYGTGIGKDAVRFERLLPGPIERVWAYLVEPDKRAAWLAGGELDPREGGKVLLRFRPLELAGDAEPVPESRREHAGGADGPGSVGRFEPPHALSIVWDDSGGVASETVFELFSEGHGVRLVLTHRQAASRDEMVDTSGGWHIHLDILAARLNGVEPPPFWSRIMALESDYRSRIPQGG